MLSEQSNLQLAATVKPRLHAACLSQLYQVMLVITYIQQDSYAAAAAGFAAAGSPQVCLCEVNVVADDWQQRCWGKGAHKSCKQQRQVQQVIGLAR
jgi:hypothetical protein